MLDAVGKGAEHRVGRRPVVLDMDCRPPRIKVRTTYIARVHVAALGWLPELK
jgi:hypothetical protein